MTYPTESDLKTLTPDERVQLLEDIWETFVAAPGSLPLSADHREEIERRLIEFQRNPTDGIPWSEARRRIVDRK